MTRPGRRASSRRPLPWDIQAGSSAWNTSVVAGSGRVEAVSTYCTNLKAAPLVAGWEARLGLPVVFPTGSTHGEIGRRIERPPRDAVARSLRYGLSQTQSVNPMITAVRRSLALALATLIGVAACAWRNSSAARLNSLSPVARM